MNLVQALVVLLAFFLSWVWGPGAPQARELASSELAGVSALDIEGVCGTSTTCESVDHLFPACWFCPGTHPILRCNAGEGICNEFIVTCGNKMQCKIKLAHTGACLVVPYECNWNNCAQGGECPDQDCLP